MTTLILRTFAFVLAIVSAPWAFSAPQPINQVQVNRSGFLYNRQTDTFDTTVTIHNTGTMPLAAPMRLVLESVKPVSVSLYNIYGKTALGKPYVEVPLPEFVLDAGKSTTVPVRFVNLGKTVTAATFSVQAEQLVPAGTARLEIAARMNTENGGNSVKAGYAIKLDGVTRAMTDAQGRASVVAPLDVSEISVSTPPNYYGATQVVGLTAGETRYVDVELGDSGEFGAESVLRMDRLQHLMLLTSVPLVVLRFFQNEKAVVSDLVELVELRDPAGGYPKNITGLFAIRSDGSLFADSMAFFTAIGNLNQKKLLFVQVLDKQGIPHLQEIPFYISQWTVQGKLSAPPSNPSLPLGGIPIKVSVLNTDITFDTESAADGTFPLPLLPSGNLDIRAVASSGGIFYLGQGTAVISGNVRIDLKMRGPIDVANNVPPIATSPL
ncbi:MAG: hypothetical protein IPK02_01035 [Candidatus Accumulibacter sp.]|uniref:DUF1573 domain-containing protein n=1 Tax=Candidatus Accumulibacter affinis TaxID=2954384 RepID=A0A935T466_9PROT|nr:hypothetical protein [Candidatus Accumulibacter affinis]